MRESYDMRQLYEWCVLTDAGGERRLSPVGVTDDKPRARAQMLEALHAVPAGVPACGWVTTMLYLPVLCCYDRYNTPIQAERDRHGAVRWVLGGSDG